MHDRLRRWTSLILIALCAGCASSRAGRGAGRGAADAGFHPAVSEPPKGTLSPAEYVPPPPAPTPPPEVEAPPVPSNVPTPPPTPVTPIVDAIVVPQPPPVPSLPAFGDYVYVEELPEAVTRVAAKYPAGTDVWGTVMVQALVDTLGNVRETRIVRSISELDSAALVAVRQWKFKPARGAGRPVAVWVGVPVKFTRP